MTTTKNQTTGVVGRTVAAVLLGLLVYIAKSAVTALYFGPSQLEQAELWAVAFVDQTALVAVSILAMLILGKGRIAAYGFKIALRPLSARAISLCLLLGGMATIIGFLLPGEGTHPIGDLPFIQIVVLAWVYASICEEIFARGLLLGFLAPLTEHGLTVFGLRISLPVLVSGLFFGLMHLALLATGMDMYSVFVIVIFACVLGIIAGHFREKTASLIPAIIVHMCFNIGGTCVDYLLELL